MIEDREMLEYDAHHANLYGTPRNQLQGDKLLQPHTLTPTGYSLHWF
jgi:hypothetical protein